MKKITEKELNRPDNKYVDRIEGEQWKMTDKYPINIISNMGRIFSICCKRLIKPFLMSKSRYYYVDPKNDKGQAPNVRLHRIIAETFIPNPDNKPIIHHIDGNRFNNRADNLMWVTAEEHYELHKQMNAKKNK